MPIHSKNPSCGAVVPLIKQGWLCKTKNRYVALKIDTQTFSPIKHSQGGRAIKMAKFEVVEATTEAALGFDPGVGSKGGNATCPFCGTVADSDYVMAEGCTKRLGQQLIAIVAIRPNSPGKRYIAAGDLPDNFIPVDEDIDRRISQIFKDTSIEVPTEKISSIRPSPNARGLSAVTRHGITTFGELFNKRQLLSLLTFTAAVRDAFASMSESCSTEQSTVITTYLAMILDRLADFNSSFCIHNYFGSSRISHTFGRHAIGMVPDTCGCSRAGRRRTRRTGALSWKDFETEMIVYAGEAGGASES